MPKTTRGTKTMAEISQTVRTNSASLNVRRRRASALLTVGCDTPSCLATRETWRDWYICWKTTIRFRSISLSSRIIDPVNTRH